MILSVLQTNRQNVLTALETLQSELYLLHAALASVLSYTAGKYRSIQGR